MDLFTWLGYAYALVLVVRYLGGEFIAIAEEWRRAYYRWQDGTRKKEESPVQRDSGLRLHRMGED